MKVRKNLALLGALIIMITVALVGVSLKQKNLNSIVIPAEEVHQLISEGKHFYYPAELEESLKAKDQNIELIDLRPPDDYLKNAIEGAVNIPFQRILDEDFQSVLSAEKIKVLYAGQESKAVEVWILLTQMGYGNIFVLKGDLNYWMAKMENKDIFGNVNFDEEKARYEFKKELEGE